MRKVYILILVLLGAISCSSSGTLNIRTAPPGKRVVIEETGSVVGHKQSVKLPPGNYTLKGANRTVPAKKVQVTVDRSVEKAVTVPVGPPRTQLKVLTNPEDDKVIDLGPAYTEVSITTSPSGAVVSLDKEERGQAPLTVDLEKGKHTVRVNKNGYHAVEKEIEIKSSNSREITLELKKIITEKGVSITPNPSDAQVFFQGEPRGRGKIDLGTVPLGTYKVKGIKELSPVLRFYGKTGFKVQDTPGKKEVELKLKEKQLYYQGKWQNYRKAISREKENYHRQKVANPVGVKVELNNSTRGMLGKVDSLARKLHTLMRVGDRIKFIQEDKTWLVWKRREGMNPIFKAPLRACLENKSYLQPWERSPNKVKWVNTRSKNYILAGIAFSLHRARAAHPLLFLSDGQFRGNGLKLERSKSDGEITVLAMQGKKLQISSARFQEFGDLLFAQLPASGKNVKISWKKPPQSLLCISDKSGLVHNLPGGKKLLMNEKELLSLVSKAEVKKVYRYSHGPDYQGWQKKVFEAAGPLADQMDLAQGQIGPQKKPGQYRRTWIVKYVRNNDMIQRQTGIVYNVQDKKKDFSGEIFIRRDKSSSRPKSDPGE